MTARARGRMSWYQQTILERAAALGRIATDPRHVEAWMRVEHGTLDSISPRAFSAEVGLAIAMIDHAGLEASEELALSYGL